MILWTKQHGASQFVVGVFKNNHKARKVYEKWGGKLDTYTEPYVKLAKVTNKFFIQ